VLPVLVPELSYEGLAISDGDMAMEAYYALQNESDPQKTQEITDSLWTYCKLDTLAMVKILEKLASI
jgi:hypothetical protein